MLLLLPTNDDLFYFTIFQLEVPSLHAMRASLRLPKTVIPNTSAISSTSRSNSNSAKIRMMVSLDTRAIFTDSTVPAFSESHIEKKGKHPARPTLE